MNRKIPDNTKNIFPILSEEVGLAPWVAIEVTMFQCLSINTSLYTPTLAESVCGPSPFGCRNPLVFSLSNLNKKHQVWVFIMVASKTDISEIVQNGAKQKTNLLDNQKFGDWP